MKKIISKIPLWVRIILCVVLVMAAIHLLMFLWPSARLNAFLKRQNSTRFYDRNGELLFVMPLEEGLRREQLPLEEIPLEVQKAFIDAEDRNFYFHPGVDFFSIIRAYSQNKKEGRIVSGASTITMQLCRLIYPRTKKVTVQTKIKEMLLSFYLEAKFSKKKILELYLNNIPFGFQVEGIASASRSFFGIEPKLLTPEQMQILATIPRRPSDYAPEKLYEYQKQCPHFIDYVISEYKNQNKKIPDEVILSVDSKMVKVTEKLIQSKLDEYQNARIHNGSAFVINNRTGEILIYVGNASYLDEEHGGQIDGVQVTNQPGSSMKPFLYAQNLEMGIEPTAVLPDIQMDFGGQGVYVPLNFNNRFNGPVRFRIALASSLNVPAVYLLYNIGIDSYLEQLKKLGFDSLDGKRDGIGLSLALGSGEVKLCEMVRAFSVFTGDGMLPELSFEKKSTAAKRNVKCYEKDTARIMCSILSDKSALF